MEAAASFWRGAIAGVPASPSMPAVRGGYLERLPLACIRAGLVERAEVWHHWREADPGPVDTETAGIVRRGFRVGSEDAPFRSNSMRGFVEAFGAPRMLCVWGLGVDEALLDACQDSFKIYNSIDAPSLRLPDAVAARFDLVLTAADWQSRRGPVQPSRHGLRRAADRP